MADSNEPNAKRRRVRKGTKSCWSCRRRKIKCEYDHSALESCIPCKDRGKTCVSQEYDDAELKAPPLDRRLGQRLSHLEQMMETLANGYPMPASASAPSVDAGDPSGTGRGSGALGFEQTDLEAAEDDLLDSAVKNAQDMATVYTKPAEHSNTPESLESSAASAAAAINPYQMSAQLGTQRNKQLSEYLYSLLPPLDIRYLLAHHSPGADIALKTFYSHSDQVAGRHEKPEALCSSTSPTASSHPALLAKRILQVSLCIQHLPPNFDVSRLRMGRKQPCEMLALWVGAVGLLVTNNNHLLGCIEGLESLLLLAMFQGNSGHLRKAWMTTRKALNMAQLMGVDRRNPPPLRSCTPGGNRASLTMMWFRINSMDRYNSLILGLPIGSISNAFAAQIPDDDDGMDKLGKAYTVLAGRLAARNEVLSSATSENEISQAYALTQSIDLDLERAARSIENSWWTIPDLPGALCMTPTDDGKAFLARTVRNRLQVRHFTLLILLHLPYLLKERQEPRYEYSRTTAIKASRAILDRFLEFRNIFIGTINGRYVDYSALMAAMALCLGYLGPGRDEDEKQQDREKVEKAQAKFHEMSLAKNDRLAKESSETIRDLLPVMQRDGMALAAKAGRNIHVTVPFLGTVNISSGSDVPHEGGLSAYNAITTSDTATFAGTFFTPYAEQDSSAWDSHISTAIGTQDESFTGAAWDNFSADLESWALQGYDAIL